MFEKKPKIITLKSLDSLCDVQDRPVTKYKKKKIVSSPEIATEEVSLSNIETKNDDRFDPDNIIWL